MEKKRVLVTGGAGFIGSHLVDHLVNEGHKVTVLDDLSGGFKDNVNAKSRFVKGSINDAELVDRLVKRSEIVYHLAAYAAEGLSHFIRRFNYTNNLLGSINLINSAIRHPVERFVFTSSMAIYGSGTPPFSEETPANPEDPYGISKYAVERDLAVARETHGLNFTIIRPHNVYGERQNIADPYRNVIGIFMNRIMMGMPPLIFGDGTQTRAFSYVGDVAPCIAKSAFIDETNGEVVNIGSRKEYSLNELAKIITEAMNSGMKPEHVPPRYEVKHAFCTTEKSERLLGFKERTSLEDGIKRMALWALDKGPMKPTLWRDYEITKNLPVFWKNLRDDYKDIKWRKK